MVGAISDLPKASSKYVRSLLAPFGTMATRFTLPIRKNTPNINKISERVRFCNVQDVHFEDNNKRKNVWGDAQPWVDVQP